MSFKIRVDNGMGEVQTFTVPEENLWIDVEDSHGRTHYLGSLYITRDVFGGINAEWGTAQSGSWEARNPVRVFNQSLSWQYGTPDRGRGGR